ncbi:hypothetical protein FQN54_004056 [Arachnomyces sp. PD_36]|nr:hypothetical protein FQN54_004056 [Arachnomyces sp. PD_36]
MAPLTSFPSVLSTSFGFATLALLTTRYVRIHGPIPLASKIMKFHNYSYSLLSLIFFLTLISGSISSFLRDAPAGETWWWRWMLLMRGENEGKGMEWMRYIYHYSKFYEYQDALYVLANGGEVHLHFGFHHLTTPYLTYSRVLQNSTGWELFAALNTFHHALMYAYFGGMSAFRPILPYTGFLQLVLGVAGEVYIIDHKISSGEPIWSNLVAAGLLTAYFGLFVRELWGGKDGGKGKEKGREERGGKERVD